LKFVRQILTLDYRYEVIDTPSDIFMITEYGKGGELFDYIVSRGRLPPDEARKFFHEVNNAFCQILNFIIQNCDHDMSL
jgi:serine/threonine protein kinase